MTVQMVDLALTPEEMEEKAKDMTPMADLPKYPWGTSLSLDESVIDKLKVDVSDWEVGDIFHLHGIVKVTSKSVNESQHGECCNVQLQFIALGAESEDEENEEEDEHEDGEPSLEKHGYLRYNK